MLNFRNTSVTFLVLLAIFSIVSMYHVIGYWLMVPLITAYVSMLVFGSVFVCSGFYLEAFCKGEKDEKVIALSFDDGPDPEVTPRVLNILKEQDVKAVFFCIGKKVADQPELLQRIVSEGHLAGNHSYSHSALFDLWGSKQMFDDLEMADDIMALATGLRTAWFRPPYGVTNPTVAYAIRKKGYRVMGWSIRSLDTSIKSKEKIIERIKRRWHPGGIILLHDKDEKVVDILQEIIRYGKSEGYRFVRADEL